MSEPSKAALRLADVAMTAIEKQYGDAWHKETDIEAIARAIDEAGMMEVYDFLPRNDAEAQMFASEYALLYEVIATLEGQV